MQDDVRLLEEARRAARGEGEREFDDLVQETLVRVWQHLVRTGRSERTSRLVQMTLRHLRIDRWRKSEPEVVGSMADAEESSTGPMGDVLRSEWKTAVEARIRELPSDQQEAVRMRFFEGRSFREIADRQKVPVNTALGRVHLAVKRLRRELETYGDGSK